MKKNIIKFTAFCLITSMILIFLDVFVFVKSAYESPYAKFYAQAENSLDYVTIGNSTIREGIAPSISWHNYGVTGYNITASPTHPEVIIIAINEVARTQSPKVVYIDLNGLTYQKISEQEKFVKDYVDAMPDGEVKNTLINQYSYLKKLYVEDADKFEFFTYHNEFRNPENYMVSFVETQSYLKGFNPTNHIEKQKEYKVDKDTVIDLPEDGQYYLYRILETCKQYPEINFIFGKMPRFSNENIAYETYMLRSVIPVINEYGYEFIDWEQYNEEIGLDRNTDMRDQHHMNIDGAYKFTNYFTEYIIEKYNLKDIEHTAEVIEDYNESYVQYEKILDILKKRR